MPKFSEFEALFFAAKEEFTHFIGENDGAAVIFAQQLVKLARVFNCTDDCDEFPAEEMPEKKLLRLRQFLIHDIDVVGNWEWWGLRMLEVCGEEIPPQLLTSAQVREKEREFLERFNAQSS